MTAETLYHIRTISYIIASVTFFNVMGKTIYSNIVSGKGKTLLLTLNGQSSPGMYFIRITQGKKVIVEKIMVL